MIEDSINAVYTFLWVLKPAVKRCLFVYMCVNQDGIKMVLPPSKWKNYKAVT